MKRMTKLLAVIITIVMLIGIITPLAPTAVSTETQKTAASANEEKATDDEIEPKLTTAEELLKMDEEVPPDYVKDGPCPSGIEMGEDVQAVTCNELLTISKSSDDKQHASVKTYESFNDKSSKTYTENFAKIDFNSSEQVSFDPNHTGRKDHAAILGYASTNKFQLQLLILDLTQTDDKGEFVIVDSIDIKEIKHRENKYYYYSNYFTIKTACMDGKYDDTLVICCNDSAWEDNCQFVEFYQLNNNKLESKKKIDLTDYMQNTILLPTGEDDDVIKDFYSQKITVGDFDRDHIDELAVVSSLMDSPLHKIKKGETYGATEVTVFDNIFGESEKEDSPKKVFDDFIYKKIGEDSEHQYYDMMVKANCTSGDIDGNNADDIIVGGYIVKAGLRINDDISEYTDDDLWPYNFRLDKGSSQGLVVVAFDGENYKMNETPTEIEFSTLLYNRATYGVDTVPAMQTAYMSGHNQPCSLFCNGSIYSYAGSNWSCVHTYDYFNKDYKIEDDNFPYYFSLINPVSGNFTNDQLGQESFAFEILMKTLRNADDHVSNIFVCTISVENAQEGIYSDNTREIINDKEEYTPECTYIDVSGTLEAPAFGIMEADVDVNDGMRIQYAGTEYFYTDPQVVAVIQASPYFKELGDWATFMPGNEFTIFTSNATKIGGAENWSTDAGITVGIQGSGPIISVEETLSMGYTHSNSDAWGEEYSEEYSTTFKACAHDTVVVYRIPITIFAYKIWDYEKNDWKKYDDGSIYYSTTVTRLNPAYAQMTLVEYNKYVDEYNAVLDDTEVKEGEKQPVYLKRIKTDTVSDGVDVLPINATGVPANYKHEIISPEYISKDSYEFGTSGGSITSSVTKTETSEDSHTFSNGLHLNYSFKMSGSIGAKGVAGASLSVGAYLDFNYSWEHSSEESESSGITSGGEVVDVNLDDYLPQNADMLKNYHFSWQYAVWNTVLQDDLAVAEEDEIKIPVLEYILKDVVYPGQYPSNVYAKVDDTGNDVLVKWEKPIDQHGSPTLEDDTQYHIYRRLFEGGKPVGESIEVGTVDANTFSFTESISNLDKGKSYGYYVGCEYKGVDEPYIAISVDASTVTRSNSPEYLVGDADESGNIEILDATVIQKYLAKFDMNRIIDLDAADVDENDCIEIVDATLIQKHIAGYDTKTRVGEKITR